ncbi:MAG: hypothetical protein D6760_08810 [Deltaproteobacteria bacterium]|nr:MAG: hypothetical protein D6760_08810 [Deltaproteobacteria bacterium]
MRSVSHLRRNGESGVALVLVLWTFAVLAVLAGEFARAMRLDAEATRTFKQSTIAQYAAMGALNEALLAISSYNGELDEDLGEEDEEDAEANEATDEEEEGLEPVLTLLEGRGDPVTVPVVPAEGEPAIEVEVRAFSEDGKVPLNALRVDESVLRLILTNLGYDDETAATVSDSILDWRDEDDLHRESGAEDRYYESLPRPYESKDGRFDAIEELLLVRGVTRDMFFGNDERPGLRDIFTIFSRRANVLESAVSDAVRQALCGLEPEEEDNVLGVVEGEAPAPPTLSECLSGTQLGIARVRGTRPRLNVATLEARVLGDGGVVLAHVAAVVKFESDGFRTVRWYDAVFSREG